MKTKYTLFRRGDVYYSQDAATGKQTSLRTKDETEARSLLNARNEAQRQPVLNLHLARAYVIAIVRQNLLVLRGVWASANDPFHFLRHRLPPFHEWLFKQQTTQFCGGFSLQGLIGWKIKTHLP